MRENLREIIGWLRDIKPHHVPTTELLYEIQESQAAFSLPVIHQPFDSRLRPHWHDRGRILDFLLATQCSGKTVLDFGPGDGWPSLLLAPFAAQVTGVDAAAKRVAVCRANAERLGLTNAAFHLLDGGPLPFADATFDAVTAASSVEQSQGPQATLRELHRVLKPGGRLRLSYEALDGYRGENEQAAEHLKLPDGRVRLLIYDRHLNAGTADNYGLTFQFTLDEWRKYVSDDNAITLMTLRQLAPMLQSVTVSRTLHPSGIHYAQMLRDLGFSEVQGTRSGGQTAISLYQQYPTPPQFTLAEVDEMLCPAIRQAVRTPAPYSENPHITAVKKQ